MKLSHALFLLAVAVLVCIQFPGHELVGYDAYYHVKVAKLFADEGILEDFPWTRFSLQRDGFGDKEFLFHMGLVPFIKTHEVYGAKVFIIVVGSLVFATFFQLLRAQQARYPLVWFLLLLGGGEIFLFRMSVVRPQVLSVALTLLLLHALFVRNHWLAVIVSFLYPLAYCAPHVVFAVWASHLVASFIRNRSMPWQPAAWSVGGVLAGFLVHPHFPHILKVWYVQNAIVMVQATIESPVLNMAGELASPTGADLIRSTWPLLAVGAASIFLSQTSGRKTSVETMTLFQLVVLFFVLTLLSKRFLEYLVPLTVLYSALLTRDCLPSDIHARASWKMGLLAVIVVLVALAGHACFVVKQKINHAPPSNYQLAAYWLRDHSSQGDLVFTADWDDFPQLFFYNSRNHYLIALDPAFFYWHDPKRWKLWDQVRRGKRDDAYTVIKEQFGARFVFATAEFHPFVIQMKTDNRFRLRYHNEHCGVFELE